MVNTKRYDEQRDQYWHRRDRYGRDAERRLRGDGQRHVGEDNYYDHSGSEWDDRDRDDFSSRDRYGFDTERGRSYRPSQSDYSRSHSGYGATEISYPQSTMYGRDVPYSGRRFEQDYSGRGPKGYTRSDDRIKEDVCDRLEDSSEINASEIEVTVENGEVTLSGTAESRQVKRMAEYAVDFVRGVIDVHNNIRIESQEKVASTKEIRSRNMSSSDQRTQARH